MKLKFISIFFAILIALSCSNHKVKNDWKRENLQGKVMTFSEFSYKAESRFGNIEKGDREREPGTGFDFKIRFNQKGNIIEKNEYFYALNRNLGSVIKYKYGQEGNKIEEEIYGSDGNLNFKTTYKYNQKENIIEENTYNSNGTLYFRKTYKYDQKENMIEEYTTYVSNSTLNSHKTYKYDEKGRVIDEKTNASNSTLNSSKTYKYDQMGNMIEENYTEANLNYKVTYQYDQKGNQNEKNLYHKYDFLNYKQTYQIVYDKQGNWTKKIIFENKIPKLILEREYEYYD